MFYMYLITYPCHDADLLISINKRELVQIANCCKVIWYEFKPKLQLNASTVSIKDVYVSPVAITHGLETERPPVLALYYYESDTTLR